MKPLRDLILYCDRPSDTIRELSTRLNARRLYANPSRRVINTDGSIIINYGTSRDPDWSVGTKSIVLNAPSAVRQAISKVKSYEQFAKSSVPTVEFTTSASVAREWQSAGHRILARRDRLSSGVGITVLEPGDTIPEGVDFFCKYFKKTHEYRVHVFQGRVIDITQKKKRTDGIGRCCLRRTLHQRVVRSLDNGWVHAHDALHLPGDFRQVISDASIRAVEALGLDFGAVDIIAQFGKKYTDKLYGFAVLEVNTAPGLANQVTLEAYTNEIKRLYDLTSKDRYVPVRRRVRKLVPVTFISKKGNRITRMRYRKVWE